MALIPSRIRQKVWIVNIDETISAATAFAVGGVPVIDRAAQLAAQFVINIAVAVRHGAVILELSAAFGAVR